MFKTKMKFLPEFVALQSLGCVSEKKADNRSKSDQTRNQRNLHSQQLNLLPEGDELEGSQKIFLSLERKLKANEFTAGKCLSVNHKFRIADNKFKAEIRGKKI